MVGAPHQEAALALLAAARDGATRPAISGQVLREYLAATTRPQRWARPLPMDSALQDVVRLQTAFQVLEDGPRVASALESLCRAVPLAGKQVHDANIVATMLAHGRRRLATFNVKDFIRFGDRIEIVT